MIHKEKPATQKEVIDEVYYGLFGVNGSPGMVHRMEAVEQKLDDHIKEHSGNGKKKPRRLEMIAIVITVLVGLQTLGLLDGIRAVLWQGLTGRPPSPPPGIEQRVDELNQETAG